MASKSDKSSVIGPGLKVSGDLKTQEPLQVLGILDGNLQADGSVEIGEVGRVRGDVTAKEVGVDGRIDGNLNAGDKVDLRVTGRIRGDIVAPRVSMAEGSFFRGRLQTSKSGRKG
ncbi:MAG: polymer-forming cytoskeletal protein [Acidobacteriota bacterium]